MPKLYTGAEIVFKCLEEQKVNHIFGYPGGAVLPIYDELKNHSSIKHILVRHEQGATHAADGYARVTGKAAGNLLHLGPELGNGFANIHNARKARTPMLNIVGDHATYHLQYDAPLTSDLDGLAKASSNWVGRSSSPDDLSSLGSQAWLEAHKFPGQIATMLVPADCAWGETDNLGPVVEIPEPSKIDDKEIDLAFNSLSKSDNAMLFLG